MKKLGLTLVMAMMAVMLAAGGAWAINYTYTENDLLSMAELWDNPTDSAALVIYGSYGSGPEFTIEFTGWDVDGFAQIAIGSYDDVNKLDLSSYDGIQLSFSNSSYSTTGDMWVNMFVQTYNPGDGSWDNFYENTWTEIPENSSVALALDFSNAHYWQGSTDMGSVAVNNLENVYKWGFQVGSNVDTNTANLIHGTVAPVPEPGTMALLGIGLLGLAFVGQRKLKIKK